MLSDFEIRKRLAQRYTHKRELGVPAGNRKSSVNTDINSGFAEKCAADYLGCEFNCDVLDGNDGHYDFIYKEKKVDAKWLGKYGDTDEPRTSGRIIVDIHKLGIADIYVAVSGSEEVGFRCVGWCSKDDLLKEPMWTSNYPDENGIYKRYALHTSKLWKMEELKNIAS
jgi:hypothetical protein